MNFLELTKRRCSVRKYASRPVETEKLDYILEAAREAGLYPGGGTYGSFRRELPTLVFLGGQE